MANKETQQTMPTLENRVTSLETSVAVLVQELKDFKDEMRSKDDQRAADMNAIRASFQNMQNTLMQMQVSNRNQNVLVIIGVAAMVIAVILK